MVQAINSVKNVSSSKQSFGCGTDGCQAKYYECRRPSKMQRILSESGQEFVAGAVISMVWDGIANGINLIRKNKGALRGIKQMAVNAGVFGACWVAANAVLTLVLPNRK